MTMRKKRMFKSIISTFLCLALLGGTVFGVTKLLKNDSDTVEIKSSAFAVGGLDEEGKYVENKQTLYTKEMFRCDGLTVDLAKNCTSTYQIFFYDEDGDFIEATEVLSEDFEEDIADGAVNARVMITPEIPEDKTAEDFKINFFTKYSYLKGITITVNKPIVTTDDNDDDIVIKDFITGAKYVKTDTYTAELEDDAESSCFAFTPNRSYVIINNGSESLYYSVRGGGGGSLSFLELLPGETELVSHNYMNKVSYINWNINDPVPTIVFIPESN